MRTPAAALTLGIGLTLAACSGFEVHVPVMGPANDVARMVGHWDGEFESAATHRGGILELDLDAGQDTAHAVVYIIPDYGRAGSSHGPNEYVDPQPTVLALEFIQIADDEVRGRLETYRDPDTGGQVLTTFVGTLAADVMEGTYTVQYLDTGDRASGHWRAERK